MPKENGYERKDHALCYSLKVWKTGIKYAVKINDTILKEMDLGTWYYAKLHWAILERKIKMQKKG